MTAARTQILLTTALVLFIQIFKAQVTITVPSGNIHSTGLTNAEWRKPLGTYFGHERSAFIYDHAEIGQYGAITALSFFCDTLNAPGNAPLRVYMKEVANTFFAGSTTVAGELGGAQLVYDDTLSAAGLADSSWILITLANPFLHHTSNAIEVIVETNAGGAGNEGSLARGFYHYATSNYAFQYWSSDYTPPAGPGTLSYKRPNIQLVMTPAAACSGAPNAGVTNSSADTTCSSVDLYLTGNDNLTGLAYQWEDSLAGGSWTAISNATAATLSAALADTTWFRCKVSCGSSFSYSVMKQVFKRDYLACYCTSGLGGGCTSTAIDSVAIAGTALVNGNTGCSANSYVQYPAAGSTCAQVAPAQSYSLHTKFAGLVNASAWIDYDQSGQFDSTEWSLICTNCQTDSDYVTTLNVPAGAKNGLTLMRIRTRAAGNLNGYSDACTAFGSGETEDYFIGVNYDVGVPLPVGPEGRLFLYPNPASGMVWVTGSFKTGEAVRLEIMSVQGRVVRQLSMHYEGYLQIDVSELLPGAYLLKATGSQVYPVKKLVISR